MSATASAEVEIADLNDAKFIAVCHWNLAQTEVGSFIACNKTNFDGTILKNDLVCQPFGLFDLLFRQRRSVEIDRAVVVAHVKRDGMQIEQFHERCRENVLPRMLLHMI